MRYGEKPKVIPHPNYPQAIANAMRMTDMSYDETQRLLVRNGEERDDMRTEQCLTLRDMYRGIPAGKLAHTHGCRFCNNYRLAVTQLALSETKKPKVPWAPLKRLKKLLNRIAPSIFKP